jgi:uncharacterized protein (DUF58 family)
MQQVAKEILLRAKKDVFSGNLGNHLTTFKGDGLDFREIRDYEYGDDIRKLNHKATAKGRGLKTNVFNEERELNILLVLMLNGSMHFGSVKLKQEVSAEILTLLAFSALKDDNRLQGLFFSDTDENYFKPTKSESIIYEILENSLEVDMIHKNSNFKKLSEYINSTIKAKSLIFIVSDFYGEVDLSEIAHKNEVYALIVRDRFEEYPLLNGEFELIDPALLNSSEITLNKEVAGEYKKLIDDHDKELKEHFLEHKIKFGKIYTDEDIYLRLTEIIKD